MGTKQRSKASSEGQNWDKIFKGLVKMLKTQQRQLETLANERKVLRDRITMQQKRWASDLRLFKEQIAQVQEDLLIQDIVTTLVASNSELAVRMKQKEAALQKLTLDYAENQLEDFKALCDLLSNKSADPTSGGRDNNKRSSSNTQNEEQPSESLESELRRLKQEHDKFALEKDTEVSALMAEKKFVWNQYKILETDCTNKLKKKRSEVEQAEEKVHTLLASMEQLQSSNVEKDDRIAQLTSQLTKTREESNKFKEETRRLSHELDLVRKSRSGLATPVLTQCTSRKRTSNSGSIIPKKESSALQAQISAREAEKVGRRPKRKVDDVASTLETESPKLLSATFKVPKLKTPSPLAR